MQFTDLSVSHAPGGSECWRGCGHGACGCGRPAAAGPARSGAAGPGEGTQAGVGGGMEEGGGGAEMNAVQSGRHHQRFHLPALSTVHFTPLIPPETGRAVCYYCAVRLHFNLRPSFGLKTIRSWLLASAAYFPQFLWLALFSG